MLSDIDFLEFQIKLNIFSLFSVDKICFDVLKLPHFSSPMRTLKKFEQRLLNNEYNVYKGDELKKKKKLFPSDNY